MTKREIILFSILINSGLLALLFVTAVKTDPESAPLLTTVQEKQPFALTSASAGVPSIGAIAAMEEEVTVEPLDEVDQVLRTYLHKEPIQMATTAAVATPSALREGAKGMHTVEVTVKRGDMLEKMAKSYGTTVEAIRRENQLTTDKLRIGQLLKITVGDNKPSVALQEPAKSGATSDQMVYYTLKSGDSPWKVAKQYQVPFEELLRLNQLNEESAKNLKVGDKIRVR